MKKWKNWAVTVGAMMLPAASYAQAIDWNVEGSVIGGSGCQKDVDTFVAENGNDLSIVFTNLGVNLPGGGSSQLASRSNCAVRIPATIAPGVYIGELTQRMSYGVTKTARSRGSISTRSTFFGFGVSPYTVDVLYGRSINEPLLVNSRVDRFSVRTTPSWYSGWCSRSRAPRGLYQANIAVSGQKDSAREDLIMFVDGLDLKYEVVASLVSCSL